MPSRYCSACNRNLTKDSFSRTQWSKGSGVSRCSACIHGYSGGSHNNNNNNNNNGRGFDATQTARLNNASKATFEAYDLDNPFSEGAFRWVAKGHYTVGQRSGEPCVCKWFKTGGVLEAHFYDTDIDASKEAIRLIAKWNAKKLINRMVQVNLPEVWTFEPNARASWAGKKVLQEPFIQEYQKFNSNTGWADDSLPWPRVMQALSHFTYHSSNGQSLLCDLQGGVYSNGVVLTDPVVMSTNQAFGPTDLGSKGISTFFAHHVCNEYCRGEWRRPRNQTPYYAKTDGTTMEHNVPSRQSRPQMSAFAMGAIIMNRARMPVFNAADREQ